MKDAYSFDIDAASMTTTYELVRQAYTNIFTKLDLRWHCVEADNGAMGGSLSHEYHVVVGLGEDTIVCCNACGYSALPNRAQFHPSREYRDDVNTDALGYDPRAVGNLAGASLDTVAHGGGGGSDKLVGTITQILAAVAPANTYTDVPCICNIFTVMHTDVVAVLLFRADYDINMDAVAGL
uniref:Proline--tRNA ligase n=1 Tax=Lygus hesperus TaxID=30085 RepID=A0A0A9X2Q0_LYGHE